MLADAATGAARASVISRSEIEGGMRSGERRDVARLFDGLDLVPVTDAIARRAGAHLRRFRRSHAGIDLADYLIAATAEEEGAGLVTLNVKHFPMLPSVTHAIGPTDGVECAAPGRVCATASEVNRARRS